MSAAVEYNPWINGHIRLVIMRKLTDEAQVSLETYYHDPDLATAELDKFMAVMQRHMVEHNERVVLMYTKKLQDLDAMIERRGATIRELDELIERQRSMLTPTGALPNGPDPDPIPTDLTDAAEDG